MARVRAADWAGDARAFLLFWGVPAAAMAAALALDPIARTVIWSVMLAWMGGVCLINARRCGRTHCRLTGPFFLIMAVAVVGHGAGLLPLGAHGWAALGVTTVVGFAALWWGSEHLWGAYGR